MNYFLLMLMAFVAGILLHPSLEWLGEFLKTNENEENLAAFRLIVESNYGDGEWKTNIDIDDCYIVDNLIWQHGADFDLFHYAPRDSKTEIRGRIIQAVK